MSASKDRVKLYLKVREMVLEEATQPVLKTDRPKSENKQLVQDNLKALCKDFDPYLSSQVFWEEGWKHFRWAGIRADAGTKDIEAHIRSGAFADYKNFLSDKWDFPKKVDSDDWGLEARKYLAAEAPYNTGIIKNRSKLKKTIHLARSIDAIVKKYGEKQFLKGVFGENYEAQLKDWSFDFLRIWHGNLSELLGGNNQITAFHLMMDLGLQCVKPDIVLTDIFYRLGWLGEAGLDKGMSRNDVRSHYTKPNVYWVVQKVALEISPDIVPLYGKNAVRELDWIIVKYGQAREASRGICVNLDEVHPIETLKV